jgi:uncharacterized membrane protein YidH (DUF202 family)
VCPCLCYLLSHISLSLPLSPFNFPVSMASLEPTVGKRIALPMRIEPKVYFANERTFLSWLHFTVVLGGLAMGLLNFGDKISQICALMFTLIAMGVMVYALYTYHWRANKIRNRLDASYDDRWGPSVLCVFLLAAVLVNLFCKFPDPLCIAFIHLSSFICFTQCAQVGRRICRRHIHTKGQEFMFCLLGFTIIKDQTSN